jgi:hypothetical protein
MKLYDMKVSRKRSSRISRGPRKSSAERKDFLVQARVPRDLDDVLKREAKRRRLSVSHLIRNVLEDTYNLVEGVIDEVDSLVQDSVRLGDRVRRDAQQIARSARGVRADADAAVSGKSDEARSEAPEPAPGAEPSGGVRASNVAAEPAVAISARIPDAAFSRGAVAADADLADFEARTADVFAWNPVVLHRATSCVRCSKPLQRGAAAHMAVSERPNAAPRWLCQECILAL